MSVQQQQAPPNGGEWYLDTGATAHMASSSGMIASPRPSRSSRIVVGNGSSLAVTHTGHHCLPTTSNSLSLNNVLISPNLIKNLVSVKKLTRDNPVNVEFDDLGFSVKERRTKTVILRCESDGELYPITPPTTHHGFAAVTVDLWHQRLGHPGRDGLAPVLRVTEPTSSTTPSHTCHACQLGKHTRLPFSDSQHISYFPFQLIHCDIWTSPVPSVSGLQYYLVILDDYSHFAWTFPLRAKSDALLKIQNFQTFIRCHYNLSILNLQTDNGREFDNHASRTFFSAHGILLRMSCPYTSPQNGRAERILRTLNNTVRALLTHASMPSSFWAEALGTATFLLNRRPCRPRQNHTPFYLLHGIQPDYTNLRVFGCLCYPNTSATTPHKLAPRSLACTFIGYSPDHKGYRCYDRATGRVYTSRHVFFDEKQFPFATAPTPESDENNHQNPQPKPANLTRFPAEAPENPPSPAAPDNDPRSSTVATPQLPDRKSVV